MAQLDPLPQRLVDRAGEGRVLEREGDLDLARLQARDALLRLGLDQGELDARVSAGELGDREGHQRGAHRGEGGDAHAPAAQTGDGLELGLGRGDPGEDGVGVLDEGSPGVGQTDAPGSAIEEDRARLALERGDLLGDRGLRVRERLRRGRERAAGGHLAQDAEALRIEH